MKLEVGMYVRTKDGIIDKVIIDYKGKCNSPNCNCKHVSCQYNYYDEVDIINASHNIIDLIEVGDYVNGHKVLNVEQYQIEVESSAIENETWEEIEFCEIKSILTKEQFESMEYRLGDKE